MSLPLGARPGAFLAPLIVAQLPKLALAQTLGGASDPKIDLWRVLGALILSILLAFGAALAMRARMARGPAPGGTFALPKVGVKSWLQSLIMSGRPETMRQLQLIETLRLGRQTEVCHIRFAGQDVLLAVSAQSVALLSEPLRPNAITTAD